LVGAAMEAGALVIATLSVLSTRQAVRPPPSASRSAVS
jgi:hypothetical protein